MPLEPTSAMINVLIIDDHLLVRQGLKSILAEHFAPLTFGDASSAQDALDLATRLPWNLIFLDLCLPGRGGLDLLKELKRCLPKVPILVLSMYPEEQFALRVLKLGAASYIQKNGRPNELLGATESALRGTKYITQSIAQKLAAHLESAQPALPHEALSDREYQVMCLLGFGKTVKEVAAELSLSVKTISTYRSRILEKMKLTNNSQLMRYAVRHELIDAEV
jgi:two-component system, NarL family, invasion response regulator UvrY